MQPSNDTDFELRLRGYTMPQPPALRPAEPVAATAPSFNPTPSAPTMPTPTFYQPVAAPKKRRTRRLPSWRGSLLISGVALLLIVAAGLGARVFIKNSSTQLSAQTLAPSAQVGANDASSAAPTAADAPANLVISSLSLDAKLVQLDNQAGKIMAPSNHGQIGWLASSAKPSAESGTAVLVGYGDSNGAFKDLNQVQIGDSVKVSSVANQSFNYTVLATRVYAKSELDTAKVLAPSSDGGALNLVTFSSDGGNDTVLVVFTARS